jgi:hypothetical protein
MAIVVRSLPFLRSDACSRPPTTIRSYDLHASDIRRAVGEIASYHERN